MGPGPATARWIGAGIAFAAAGVAMGAFAQAPPAPATSTATAGPRICTQPNWRSTPTASQVHAVWPRAALLKGQSGRAEIGCKVTVQGALHDCVVVSETPPGAGFGLAALALAPQFLMTPQSCGGKPSEGEVHIPISFKNMAAPPRTYTGSRLAGPPPIDPGVAQASNPPSGPFVLLHVGWLAAPSYEAVVSVYPAKAAAAKVGGHVTLQCNFATEGRLGHCGVLSETPAGQGFAAAARALVPEFLGPAKLADGTATRDNSTTIAFTFDPAMLTGAAPVIGQPQWTRVPDAVDVAQGFPAAARAAHVTVGHVNLSCTVGEGGHLTGCSVTRASPEGLGFEAAALALSAVFQVTVWTEEGLPTIGGRLDVPIRYEAGTAADEAAAVPAPAAPDAAHPATPAPAPAPSGRPVAFQPFTLFAHFSAGPYYPERAARLGVTGWADLECVLGKDGALDACALAAEAPASQGFGEAALVMARKRAIRLKDAAAPKPGEPVRVTVPFTIERAR